MVFNIWHAVLQSWKWEWWSGEMELPFHQSAQLYWHFLGFIYIVQYALKNNSSSFINTIVPTINKTYFLIIFPRLKKFRHPRGRVEKTPHSHLVIFIHKWRNRINFLNFSSHSSLYSKKKILILTFINF